MQQAMQVLVVDDYPNVLSALEQVLRGGGYEVLTAGGGEQALTIIETHDELALVICDFFMRGVSGTEVLNATRLKRPNAARIALSGDTPAKTILECLNSGLVTHMLLKPWKDLELLQTVREALALRELRLENEQLKSKALEQGISSTQQDVQRLEDTIQDLVALIAFLLDLQSSGSQGHSKRVAQLSSMLAQVKGLPAEEIKQIEIAALLKDLGGITTTMQVTDSPNGKDPLPAAVQQAVGVELLKRIAGFEQIANIVSGLHGLGEPVEGEKHIGSEVLAVADEYDCQMFPDGEGIVHRPNAAEHSLVEMRGGQLNAELVDTFREQVLPSYATSEESEIEVSISQLEPGMVMAHDVLNVHSVPLLYAGTTLVDGDIASLKRNDEFNAVFSRIYIKVGSLPKAADEPVAAPPPPKKTSQESASELEKVTMNKPAAGPTKPLVVVIDDEKNVVNALKRELESSGYQVMGFMDPAEGLKYIRSGASIHSVISDYMMPGIKGDKLLQEIQDSHPKLPCIVITGHATMDTITRLTKSAKLVRMLAKPWDKAQLLETLRGLSRG